MKFLSCLIVLFLFVYSILWLASYDEALKFIELSKHLDAIQYVNYSETAKSIHYAIINKNGREILTIDKNQSYIFIFDFISNESAIDCSVPCWIAMSRINKKLLSITPEYVLEDYNSKPIKKTFKDEL